ncbi:MAG: hypothetical protein J7L26_12680 [Candidatus Aminicenantes bacterium]|nr:hypothetical protein [Candidatus Aminicenantes bacterium]
MAYQLTPDHAKLWLPVVRELREYYEGKNDKFVSACPLCKITRQITHKRRVDCELCLWVVFEKKTCDEFATEFFEGWSPTYLRYRRGLVWRQQSISRLKRWERKLEKIIGGKG